MVLILVENIQDQIISHVSAADVKLLRAFVQNNASGEGISERLHKTMINEFSHLTVHKKIAITLADLQSDLDRWVPEYNEEQVHQGSGCSGRTLRQTFCDTP